MPVQHAGSMGPKDALMQLASEAVRVAAQSPFLENAVGRARAVLCCLYLPVLSGPIKGARYSPSLIPHESEFSADGILCTAQSKQLRLEAYTGGAGR